MAITNDYPEGVNLDTRYTQKEAAKFLGVNASTIYRWVKVGKIKATVIKSTDTVVVVYLGSDILQTWRSL